MNLIERFGYDTASKMSMSEVGLKKDMEKLQHDLLEYRRQHNIFEIGDKVVLKNSRFGSCNDSVYNVVWINKTHFLYELCCGWCGYSHYLQHATNEEIKAGCRL